MRMLLVAVLWVVATVAATGLAFGAVAIVGEAATAPPAVLAPIDAPGDGPVEIVSEDGALAVECEADAITLVWAQPAGGSTVAIRESGPSAVVVEFAEEDDEVTRVEVVCVDGEPTWVVRDDWESWEPTDEPGPTTSTTEPDDDDDRPTTSTTEPDDDDDDRPTTSTTEADRSTSTSTTLSTTSTTEADDDDDVTSTTEADDDDDVTSTTEADDDDDVTSTTEADDDDDPDDPDDDG